MCNDAGTFQFGAFGGQSNDISPDTIYLCYLDSIFINHDGNASFVGDPTPLTPSGIVYGFYDCPPTITGPDLPTLLTDGCIDRNATQICPMLLPVLLPVIFGFGIPDHYLPLQTKMVFSTGSLL